MEPINVFVAYSDKDYNLMVEISDYLSPMSRHINLWEKSRIIAGQEQNRVIKTHLDNAHIVLALVSADLLASREDFEMALNNHKNGQSVVIPILLSNCLWKETELSGLEPLPTKNRTIDSWQNRTDAWKEVADGVDKCIKYLRQISLKFSNAVDEAENHFNNSRWNAAYQSAFLALSFPQSGFRPSVAQLLIIQEKCSLAIERENEQVRWTQRLEKYQNMVSAAYEYCEEKKWLKAKISFEKAINHYELNFIPEVGELKTSLENCNNVSPQKVREIPG